MDNFAMRYLVWAPTLRITLSKFGSQVSYITGVLSKFLFFFFFSNRSNEETFKRCDATPDNLGSGTGHRRTHEKTDFLINNFDSATIWDVYGINENIVVCEYLVNSFQG